jgi:hypothetical protein
MNNVRCTALGLVTLGLLACSTAAPVISPDHDPSSAQAPESPAALASPTLAGGALVSTPSERPDGGAERFVCPMHADVVADHPGQCPKCHMRMVPLEAR